MEPEIAKYFVGLHTPANHYQCHSRNYHVLMTPKTSTCCYDEVHGTCSGLCCCILCTFYWVGLSKCTKCAEYCHRVGMSGFAFI